MNNYVGIYVYISSRVFKIMETLIIFSSLYITVIQMIQTLKQFLFQLFCRLMQTTVTTCAYKYFFQGNSCCIATSKYMFVYDCNSVRTCLFQILFLITYFKRLVYHQTYLRFCFASLQFLSTYLRETFPPSSNLFNIF